MKICIATYQRYHAKHRVLMFIKGGLKRMAILYNIKKVVLTELDESTGAAKSSGIVTHIKTAQKQN